MTKRLETTAEDHVTTIGNDSRSGRAATRYHALPNVLRHVGCGCEREKVSVPGLTLGHSDHTDVGGERPPPMWCGLSPHASSWCVPLAEQRGWQNKWSKITPSMCSTPTWCACYVQSLWIAVAGGEKCVIPPMTLLCDNMHEDGRIGRFYNMP